MTTTPSRLNPAHPAQANAYEVFPAPILAQIANDHKECLQHLAKIEADLMRRFVKLEDAILGIILSVASGEPLLFVGPPGTAKSWLVRAFCQYIGIDLESKPADTASDEDSDEEIKEREYFEYLLTSFTEPSELFGYLELVPKRDKNNVERQVLERKDQGMMQFAKVVFLDEVFKGSSAILNSLLSFINEHIFHDRGQRKDVNMECLFGATNETPRPHEFQLRAIFDRFTLRVQVNNVQAEPDQLFELLARGWPETYRLRGEEAEIAIDSQNRPCLEPPPEEKLVFPDLLEQLKALRRDIRCRLPDQDTMKQGLSRKINDAGNGHTDQAIGNSVSSTAASGSNGSDDAPAQRVNGTPNKTFPGDLAVLVKEIRDNNLSQMSNRRVIKFVYILLIYSLYDAVRSGYEPNDPIYFKRNDMIDLLIKFTLDRFNDRDEQAEQHLRDQLKTQLQ